LNPVPRHSTKLRDKKARTIFLALENSWPKCGAR
jgi:hypothetical protein